MRKRHLEVTYILVLLALFMYYYLPTTEAYAPIEELDIPVGIGFDLDEQDPKEYNISLAVYSIESGKVNTVVREGKGSSIGETRQDRQRKTNRRFLIGTQKVIVISDKLAYQGIEDMVNTLFNSPIINDKAEVGIYHGSVTKAFNIKLKGIPSTPDFLEGVINNASNYNFFTDNYKTIDIYQTIGAEGRKLVLPYIAYEEDSFKIIGSAVFKDYKIAEILDFEGSRAMNILRGNRSRGLITIKSKDGENTDLLLYLNRKVKCTRDEDKYKFTIELKGKFDVLETRAYKDIMENNNTVKILTDDAEKVIKEMCQNFIQKMQHEYKIDCLDLGSVAAAKYGRRSGIDWDKAVPEGEININVKLNFDRLGRGKYK